MTRAVVLAAVVVPLAAVAAPPPRDDAATKLKKEWGDFENTDGDCTAKLVGPRLTISTPHPGRWQGRWTNLPADQHTFPRVVRRVTGDFEMRVAVVKLTDPNPSVRTRPDWSVYDAEAGLIVADALGVAVGIYRQHAIRDPERRSDVVERTVGISYASRAKPSVRARNGDDIPPDRAVTLRLGRKGGVVYTAHSPDGKTWVEHVPRPNAAELADAVTVGVYLTHTTAQACDAVFEDFAFTQPAK